MSTCLHGIDAHIKKLDAIAIKCGQKEVDKEEKSKDEFINKKREIHKLVEEVREGCVERKKILDRRGICHETITKGHDNREKLRRLQMVYGDIQALHKKTTGKRRPGQSKEELHARWEDIRTLKKLVDNCRESVEGGNFNEDPTLTESAPRAQLFGLREAGQARGDPDTKRAMNEEEEQALAAMKARDEAIDEQVGQVGDVLDRLKDVGLHMGEEAERQKRKIDEIDVLVDKNSTEIKRQDDVAKSIIQYQKNTDSCCKMVMGLMILAVVGVVFKQMGMG